MTKKITTKEIDELTLQIVKSVWVSSGEPEAGTWKVDIEKLAQIAKDGIKNG